MSLKLKLLPPRVAGAVMLAVAFASTDVVFAQKKNEESIRFPADPEAWLNSPPISNEILKGKAAILYFFEEG